MTAFHIPPGIRDMRVLVDWADAMAREIGVMALPGERYKSLDELYKIVNDAIDSMDKQKVIHSPMPRSAGKSLFSKYLYKAGSVGKPYRVNPFTNAPVPTTPNPEAPVKFSLPKEQSFGEITAFRMWRVRRLASDKIPLLVSTFKDTLWLPGKIMQAHALPSTDASGVGLHGWKSVVETVEYGRQLQAETRINHQSMTIECGPTIAFGRIHLWGDVIEHQRGYRAEFARIIGIDDLIISDGLPEGVYDIYHDRMVFKNREEGWSEERLRELQWHYFPELRR